MLWCKTACREISKDVDEFGPGRGSDLFGGAFAVGGEECGAEGPRVVVALKMNRYEGDGLEENVGDI